jgi:hypothetical protein
VSHPTYPWHECAHSSEVLADVQVDPPVHYAEAIRWADDAIEGLRDLLEGHLEELDRDQPRWAPLLSPRFDHARGNIAEDEIEPRLCTHSDAKQMNNKMQRWIGMWVAQVVLLRLPLFGARWGTSKQMVCCHPAGMYGDQYEVSAMMR